MEKSINGIVSFNCKTNSHIKAITELHLKLVPESHPSRLGKIFMEKFYFSALPQFDLLNGYLYAIEDDYVGFIIFTKKPGEFIFKGIKRAPLQFLLTLIIMFVYKPLSIFRMLSMFLKKRKKSNNKVTPSNQGQWLTFGVLPQELKHVDKNGKRISQKLVEEMLDWFKNNKIQEITAGVRKNNLPAILFYNSMGFSMNNNEHDDEFYDFLINL
tara:strand:- start:1123 stop:1761 length:639 start_codon:yes stop_codon:yes gene_type:complete